MAAPQTQRTSSRGRLRSAGGTNNYAFTPKKSGFARTHHFTNGLDGYDAGDDDPMFNEFKKHKYREALLG